MGNTGGITFWKIVNMSADPKLSVHILTYNHAAFLRQTLDSVLAQRCSFDYEIVIGDDCSNDGTQDLIRHYHRLWPKKIRPLFREKNLGPALNFVDTLQQCRGEYIAFLEGDDCWTDVDKIQLQTQYLDKHPGCAVIHHRVVHVSWPSGERLAEFPAPAFRIERPPARLLAMINFIQTCSVMFRRSLLPKLDEHYIKLKIGDWPLFVLLSQKGWIGYLDRTMAQYRIHANNSWANRPADYKIRAMEEMAWYLLQHVSGRSQGFWKDTILALAFKDLLLNLRALALRTAFAKFKYFARTSRNFQKPFWLLNSLWPYYRAHSASEVA